MDLLKEMTFIMRFGGDGTRSVNGGKRLFSKEKIRHSEVLKQE